MKQHGILVSLLIFLFVFVLPVVTFCQGSAQLARVPGTRLWIREIPNYEFVGTYPTLHEKKGGVQITFSEAPFALEQFLEYVRDHRTESEWTLITEKPFEASSLLSGYVLTFHKTVGLIDTAGFTNETFVYGDSVEAFQVSVSYFDSTRYRHAGLLKRVTASLQWRKESDLDPMQRLRFTLNDLKEYAPISRTTNGVEYTPYGLAPDSAFSIPYYSVGTLYTQWTDPSAKEKRAIAEELLTQIHPLIRIEKVMEHEQIDLDGIEAYETIARGINIGNDSTVFVYQTVLFHPDGFVGFTGISPAKRYEDHIAAFKAMTRSFERLKVDQKERPDCYQLLASKQFEKAEKCYWAALKADSASASALLGRAQSLHGLKKFNEAIVLFTALIERREAQEAAYLGRARSLVGVSRYRDAIQDYDKAILLNRRMLEYYVERGEAKDNFGNGPGAAMDYEKAIEMSPSTVHYYLAYARSMLGCNEPSNAAEMLRRAEEVDSSNGEIYSLLGEATVKMEKYSEALDYYIRAEARGCRRAEMFLQRSRVKLRFDDVAGAFDDASAACRSDKRSSDAYCMRGKLALFLGRMDDAVTDLTAATRFGTDWDNPLYFRGIAYLLTKRYKEAAADFRTGSAFYGDRVLLYLAEKAAYSDAAAKRNLVLFTQSIETKDERARIAAATDYEVQLADYAHAATHNDWLAAKFALKEITFDDFFDAVKKNDGAIRHIWRRREKPLAIGEAYFMAGMLDYASGLKIGSRKNFERCIDSLNPDDDLFQISRIILKGVGQER